MRTSAGSLCHPHDGILSGPKQTDSLSFYSRFYGQRDRFIMYVGFAMILASVLCFFFSVAQMRGFAVAQMFFVLPLVAGIVVSFVFPCNARRSFFRECFLPAEFVLDRLRDELHSDKNPDAKSRESFVPVLMLFNSAVLRNFSADHLERLFEGFDKVVGDIVGQAEKFTKAVLLILESLKLPVNPSEGFVGAQAQIQKAMGEPERLQRIIAKSIGQNGTETFRLRCIEALREKTAFEADLKTILDKAISSLEKAGSSKMTEAESKILAEEICLNFRALYIACLITATFNPEKWREVNSDSLINLFGEAIKRMAKLDASSPYLFNVERRQVLLGELA